MKRIKYIKLFLSLLLMPLTLTSCIFDDAADDSPTPDQKDPVLVLRTCVVGGTRDGETNPKEAINSIRIIVADVQTVEEENGYSYEKSVIEYSECKNVEGDINNRTYYINVKPGVKDIYVIANDESVDNILVPYKKEGDPVIYTTTSLHDELEREDNDILSPDSIFKLIYKPKYQSNKKPLPLAAYKRVNVTAVTTRAEIEPIYLVRAATKFDVTIKNNRSNAVKLQSFDVNKIASLTYLFAQLEPTQNEETGENEFMIYTFPNQTENETPVKHPFIFDGDNKFTFTENPIPWDEWLYHASKESELNKNDETPIADNRGWIMDYKVPASPTNEMNKYVTEKFDLDESTEMGEIAKGKKLTLATRYFVESAYHNYNDNGIKKYSFNISFLDNLNNESKEYTDLPFNNLRALFRNTHVKLDIELNETTVTYKIYVRPWKFYRLDEIIM